MDITFKKNYVYELIFIDDNVKIEEDIESREYQKGEDGKTDFNLPPKRDIKTDSMQLFVDILCDMAYYRVAEFDSSDLIEQLFAKLPESKAKELLVRLSDK